MVMVSSSRCVLSSCCECPDSLTAVHRLINELVLLIALWFQQARTTVRTPEHDAAGFIKAPHSRQNRIPYYFPQFIFRMKASKRANHPSNSEKSSYSTPRHQFRRIFPNTTKSAFRVLWACRFSTRVNPVNVIVYCKCDLQNKCNIFVATYFGLLHNYAQVFVLCCKAVFPRDSTFNISTVKLV
jgi:hypothetical protein